MFPRKLAGTVHAGVVGKPLSCNDWLIGSEKRSDKKNILAYNPPEGNIQVVYKWYILPIGGLYATDPTFYGNQRQTLTMGFTPYTFDLDIPLVVCH